MNSEIECKYLVLASGRSGSHWMSDVCSEFNIHILKNRVDIGVRVELPAEIFKHMIGSIAFNSSCADSEAMEIVTSLPMISKHI